MLIKKLSSNLVELLSKQQVCSWISNPQLKVIKKVITYIFVKINNKFDYHNDNAQYDLTKFIRKIPSN